MNKEAQEKSFTAKVLHGIHWSYASTLLLGLLQIVVISLLAHLLTPHDFGVVGIALIFISFSDRFGELGVNHALIQRESLSEETTKTAASISLLLGAVVSVMLLFTAPMIGSFFREPAVVQVLQVISCMILIESFAVVPRSLLQRELRLKALMMSRKYCLSDR